MRAIRFRRVGGPDALVLEESEEPKLRANAVRVAVKAAGVNYADVHFRKGEYFQKPVFPQIPGLEASGVIEAIGDGVEGLRVGDRVIAFTSDGAYAEKLVTPAHLVYPMPDALTFEQGAALAVQGLTAMHALSLCARVQRGECVLVHAAAGGVGLMAVQLAKILGAGFVVGTASSEEKCALVRELGADLAIDYRTEDFSAAIKSKMRGEERAGVDVILEMLGGTETYKRNLALLAPFGRMVVYGAASGDLHGTIEPVALMGKSVTIIGYYLTRVAARRELCAPQIAELAQLVVDQRLRVVIAETFPLDRAQDAHRAIESRKTVGKIVLTVS